MTSLRIGRHKLAVEANSWAKFYPREQSTCSICDVETEIEDAFHMLGNGFGSAIINAARVTFLTQTVNLLQKQF